MTRSTLIKKAWLALVLVGWASVALTALPREAEAEPLYFALEVRREGRLVAQPKLLGETGRTVRAERRKPGAPQPDYRLVLTPTAEGKAFHLELDLALPELKGHSELSLLHGQERRVQLGRSPGDLEVSLLLMKVDSPEFRALMDLTRDAEASDSGLTI
ncbi:hypothetical protein D187_000151 [Cystobacter fuscus DSM 2262]|uniref:Uncharacterized protein n=1 Tax=Cystobacter fuscus (strain ATCC 25194 / DSM 2262 / NBRC 100088 / M29) TaxID=1242864 RepID=S9QTU6_CYSF2|nr:hypothetical protein [Cystobacter fuscus]EPX64729.1 hypothetical protein D187_000151 [Cystobacter fuscus DSM 2262]